MNFLDKIKDTLSKSKQAFSNRVGTLQASTRASQDRTRANTTQVKTNLKTFFDNPFKLSQDPNVSRQQQDALFGTAATPLSQRLPLVSEGVRKFAESPTTIKNPLANTPFASSFDMATGRPFLEKAGDFAKSLIFGKPSETKAAFETKRKILTGESVSEEELGSSAKFGRQQTLNLVAGAEGGVQAADIAESFAGKIAKNADDIPVGPEDAILKALKESSPLRAKQEKLYTEARGERFTRAEDVRSKFGEGEKAFYESRAQLAGEMPKIKGSEVRSKLSQESVDGLFKKISQSPLFEGDKQTAFTGLINLLDGTVPTKSQLEVLGEIYSPKFVDEVMANRTTMKKIWDASGEVLSVPRALLAGGFDMSFGLRQGVYGAYKYPREWFSSMKDQFKWFFDESQLQKTLQTIEVDPVYQLAKDAKLAMFGSGSKGIREEAFAGTLAEKIPVIGAFVKASSRAYNGFATKFRFDIFKNLVENAKKTGDIADPTFLPSLAKHINTLTGRGHLGKLESVADVAATAIFSPRYFKSKLDLFSPYSPVYYASLHPAVRKEALKGLFAYLAGTGTLLGLADLAGAEVGTDPTSSDFLKIKVGNTRFDITGGNQQILVLMARLVTGKLTSSSTGKVTKLGEGYKPLTRKDLIYRFFENKTAPILSFLIAAATGTNAVGDPFELKRELKDRVVPLFIQDMVDLYNEGNIELWPLAAPAAFFGISTQTYGSKEGNLGPKVSTPKPKVSIKTSKPPVVKLR